PTQVAVLDDWVVTPLSKLWGFFLRATSPLNGRTTSYSTTVRTTIPNRRIRNSTNRTRRDMVWARGHPVAWRRRSTRHIRNARRPLASVARPPGGRLPDRPSRTGRRALR